MGIDSSQRARRMAMNRIEEEDRRLLRELAPLLERHMTAIVDDFYDHLGRFPEMVQVVSSAGSSIEKLKKTNPRYFAQMMEASFDEAYFESRLLIGRIHAEIGLRPELFFAAMSSYYQVIIPLIAKRHRLSPEKSGRAIAALLKAFNLDQALLTEAYVEYGLMAPLRSVIESTKDASQSLQRQSSELKGMGRDSGTSVQALAQYSSDLYARSQRTGSDVGARSEDDGASTYQLLSEVRDKIESINSQAQVWTTLRSKMELMGKVLEALRTTSARVKEMNDRSSEIGRIVVSIEQIAKQTNLLALNAAIEAARAGDAGRGFAVVADDVRRLSESTSGSAKEISELIKRVQEGAQDATSSMDQSLDGMEEAAKVVSEAASALAGINQSASETAAYSDGLDAALQRFNEIVSANDRLLKSISEQTAESTSEMQAFTESMLTNVEHLLTGVDEMDAQVSGLAEAVADASAALQKQEGRASFRAAA